MSQEQFDPACFRMYQALDQHHNEAVKILRTACDMLVRQGCDPRVLALALADSAAYVVATHVGEAFRGQLATALVENLPIDLALHLSGKGDVTVDMHVADHYAAKHTKGERS